jgi:hypothetical protein
MKAAATLVVFAHVLAAAATAEVVGVEIVSLGDLADGAAYGPTGSFEKLAGKLHFSVDPQAAANRMVADLGYAPTNAENRVEFSADFYLIKPKAAERGNGTLLLEVSNRGSKGILPMLNHADRNLDPTTAAALGDGFLLTRGYTLLWVGWQLDPPTDPSLLHVYPPAATDGAGPLRGIVRSDFVVRERVFDHSLGDGAHIAYPVADADSPNNTLTVRSLPHDAPSTIARSQWSFARVAGPSGGDIVADPTRVYLKDGFEPHKIYEVVYEAHNPPVAGLGLVAIRDAVARLKYEGLDELGIAGDSLERAIAFGISQSGRVLRTFLYEGFNADERQRKVFDGVMAHIAGGARGGFNLRFAQPARSSASYLHPNEVFPFTDTVQTDPVSGVADGLLARSGATKTTPKIFYTNSSNEYWRGSAALTHISADGARDLEPIDTTRIYLFAGTQHTPAAFPARRSNGQLANNPHDYTWFLRALVVRMNDWIADRGSPPPSRYPTLAEHTLVARSDLRFPALPGTIVPARLVPVHRLDYGPQFATRGVITNQPPIIGAPFPLLLPQVDSDGNEIAGLRSPALAAPLATYTGWSLYAADFGPTDELASLQGSYIPLAVDRAQRELIRDPRPSIDQRYRNLDHYLELIAQHAEPLIAQGYLLAEDLPGILRQAEQHWEQLVVAR